MFYVWHGLDDDEKVHIYYAKKCVDVVVLVVAVVVLTTTLKSRSPAGVKSHVRARLFGFARKAAESVVTWSHKKRWLIRKTVKKNKIRKTALTYKHLRTSTIFGHINNHHIRALLIINGRVFRQVYIAKKTLLKQLTVNIVSLFHKKTIDINNTAAVVGSGKYIPGTLYELFSLSIGGSSRFLALLVKSF